MPTYEYECTSCCFRFERKQHFHEEPLATCPRCQAAAHRRPQSVAIVFKGSGFYTTDHGRGSTWNNKSETEDSAPKSDETKAAVKADVKSEAKGEAKKD